MERKAPAPPLRDRQVGWLIAAGLAVFLPLMPQVPAWLSGIAGLAFFWRLLLAWQRRPLPSHWLLLLVSLVGIAGVLIEYRTVFGQRAGVALLVLLMSLKQLEARTPRDGLAIILLSYFMALAQFFDEQSIVVALIMIASVVVATAALASLADGEAPAFPLLRLTSVLLIQALPFMLILFVLFPRVSGPLWGLPLDAYSSLSGLSDTMSPGLINRLVQSEVIAFRVKFEGPVPPRKDLYWRGPVLSRLSGRTWEPGITEKSDTLPYLAAGNGPAYAYTITLEPHNKHWLFALELPESVPAIGIATSNFQIQSRQPVRERVRYDLVSHPAIEFAAESPRVLKEALSLPPGDNPRTVALGRRWREETPGDADRLQRAADFMRGQSLIYTLQPPLMERHVADEFLFVHQRGFCEHFSAAFVVLLRAAGIPARVVTGYQGGERNPVDDTWIVRQSEAHAWAEAWIEGRGWVRVDPTAISMPRRIDLDLASAVPAGDPLPFLSRGGFDFLRNLRFGWWALSNSWNQWVLGYNPQRQQELLRRLGMRAPDWRSMTAVLAVLCGLTLLALAGWILWRRPRADPVERQWSRLSTKLHRLGLPRHPWEGPTAYARRIQDAQPALAAEISRIAALYAGLRYGSLPASSLDELRRCITTLPT